MNWVIGYRLTVDGCRLTAAFRKSEPYHSMLKFFGGVPGKSYLIQKAIDNTYHGYPWNSFALSHAVISQKYLYTPGLFHS